MVVCLAVDARIYTPLFDYQTVACLAWTMMVNLLSKFHTDDMTRRTYVCAWLCVCVFRMCMDVLLEELYELYIFIYSIMHASFSLKCA